jgi:hypothetical protein
MSGISLRAALLAGLLCVTALVVAFTREQRRIESPARPFPSVRIWDDLVPHARAHPLFGVGSGIINEALPDFMPCA